MLARATTLAIGFSQKLMAEMYDNDLVEMIVNRDYEGEINAAGSKLNILNFDRIAEKDYTGVALTADDLTENNSILVIDKKKAFYWKQKTLDNWLSYIKEPKPTIVTQVAGERRKNMETHILGFYGDVAAGNRVGTDYTTGTVTITAVTGAVVGSATTFTAAMVGKGFKATGHTKWYRVLSYASATSIVIEDDKDDVTSAYTGGTINAGATYTIEAATVVSVTTSNLLAKVAAMRAKMDIAERNGKSTVPAEDRTLLVPAEFEQLLVQASGVALHVPAVYQELVKMGMLTELLGFKVMKTNRLTGNNTDGFHVLAIQKKWMTFADKILEATIEEDLPGDFGTAYKDLFVYGGKVTDSRRHFAAELFCTFSV